MSLNCPNCGAGARPDAVSCDYCGSRLATVACPACLGSMFVGTLFCPHCGAAAAVPQDVSGAVLTCPGCLAGMAPVLVGAVAMHQCGKCGSAWVDRTVFETLCMDRQQQGAAFAALGGTAVPPLGIPQGARYVKCPNCAKVMNRVNFARRSGIVVDVCKPHGIWFERDELHAVLAFVAQGGLEHAVDAGDSASVARLKALNTYDGLNDGGAEAHRGAEAVLRLAQGAMETHSPLAMILDSLFR